MQQLAPEQLRRRFDPRSLGMDTTESVPPLAGIIGQTRAVAALRFGLNIRDIGFNIFVAGPPGIGKMTTVRSFLEGVAGRQPTPPDWCYVNNFEDPYQPKPLRLPAGRGRALQQDMHGLIEHARREIPKAFEADGYGAQREAIVKDLEDRRSEIQDHLTQEAAQAGFSLQASPSGILLIPMVKGRPLKESEFMALPAQARDDFQHRREGLDSSLKAAMKEIRNLERSGRAKIGELDRQVMLYVVGGLMEDIREKHEDSPDVLAFLDAVQKDILENIELFRSVPSASQAEGDAPAPPSPRQRDLSFRKYQVNLLVDNSQDGGVPVIVEMNPTFNNLFGRIEKETEYGTLVTDLTLIVPGALHSANGGYLVVQAEDLLRNQYSWDGLKRALRSRQIDMEDLGERLGFVATKTLRPGPIPLDLKLVMIGSPVVYYALQYADEGFAELFKVKADFDTSMPVTAENIQALCEFAGMLCRKDNLRHLDAAAMSGLLEHAARMAEDQNKLSTHFGILANIIREANFWAAQEQSPLITANHLQKALGERIFRSNLVQERIGEMIARELILIDTAGEKVGQVNGLSVITVGDYAFGRPSRITASVGPGREGIIDLEREVELGGPIYSKGVLLLGGLLMDRYAQARPLSMAARLGFEQSYEGIEGDSASSAELYALLSALSGLPIRQGIAVTGSVNQHGQVQAIGGVNEKIEGFFEICCAKGLTGAQGVIVPKTNVQNLMLRDPVVQAVQSGKFQIWAVETIDEGIEILTGVPAGARAPSGEYPEGSVNQRVDRRLKEFAETLREYAGVGLASNEARSSGGARGDERSESAHAR